MSKTEFKSFRAENAGCIQEAEMPLEDQGLVCIQGQNLDEGDSNGSGKTTLFELLAQPFLVRLLRRLGRMTFLTL